MVKIVHTRRHEQQQQQQKTFFFHLFFKKEAIGKTNEEFIKCILLYFAVSFLF